MTALAGTRSQLPDHWPAALSPDCLEVIDLPTPYLVTDLDTVVRRLAGFHRRPARRAAVLRDEVQPGAGDPHHAA